MSVHTDDLLFTAQPDQVAEIKAELGALVSIRWEGTFGKEWTKHLGFEWSHADGEVRCRVPVSYYLQMLRDWKMERCKPAVNPFSPQMHKQPEDSPSVDEETHARYRRTVGQLLWLLPARPILAYSIKELARAVTDPKVHHIVGLKRVLRYLLRTKLCTLVLKCDKEAGLQIWTDSDWRAPRSTSGAVYRWNGVLLEASSKTQCVPALSSGEAELIALNESGKEGRYLQQILEEIEDHPVPITLFCDSNAAIGSAKRMGVGKIRHLELRELWIQEQVSLKRINLSKVLGAENQADVMTKQIKGQQLFEMLCECMGERCGPAVEDDIQCCAETLGQQNHWRQQVRQMMERCGYEKFVVENSVQQMASEAEARVFLSQLAVIASSE